MECGWREGERERNVGVEYGGKMIPLSRGTLNSFFTHVCLSLHRTRPMLTCIKHGIKKILNYFFKQLAFYPFNTRDRSEFFFILGIERPQTLVIFEKDVRSKKF